MRTKLTPNFISRAAAPTTSDRAIYWDQGLPGFGLMVTKAGHRSFVYQYRAGRRSRRMTFSVELGLEKARKEARKALGGVAGGADPLQDRRRAERPDSALQAVCENYLAREGDRLRSRPQIESTLRRLVYPKFGGRQIESILRSELITLLDRIADNQGPIASRYTLAVLSKIMGWHASRSDDFRSPIVRGMARAASQQRERTLTDDELRAVWKAAGEATGPFGAFVQFVLLTTTRRTEAARIADGELSGTDWTIPAARYKTKRDHVIPLSQAARDLLAGLPRTNGVPYFFTTGAEPISGFSKFKEAFDEACGVTGWTLHDLRRTGRSLMSRAGVEADHAERCLGHVIGGVRGTYDRWAFHPEKARAFEALAAQIDRIVNPVENVVALRATAAD